MKERVANRITNNEADEMKERRRVNRERKKEKVRESS